MQGYARGGGLVRKRREIRRFPYWEIMAEIVESAAGLTLLLGGLFAVWIIGCGLA